jgi:hypothetical protein
VASAADTGNGSATRSTVRRPASALSSPTLSAAERRHVAAVLALSPRDFAVAAAWSGYAGRHRTVSPLVFLNREEQRYAKRSWPTSNGIRTRPGCAPS